MKEIIKKNFRFILIICSFTVIVVCGFSFAYASEENQLYTRDELSNIVSELKDKEDSRFTVYETSTILNPSLTMDAITKGCELTITEPGNYLILGHAWSLFNDSNGELDCRFIGTDFDVWSTHESSEMDPYKYCGQNSYIKVSSSKTFYLDVWQQSSSLQTLSACIIKAIKI